MTTIIKAAIPAARNVAAFSLTGIALALGLATSASAASNTPPAAPTPAVAAVAAPAALPQKDANGPGGSSTATRGRDFAPQLARALTPQQMSDAWSRELNRIGLPSVNDSLASLIAW